MTMVNVTPKHVGEIKQIYVMKKHCSLVGIIKGD
jgi:hypothetical protein